MSADDTAEIRWSVQRRLQLDSVAVEAVRELEEVGIEAIVLKGPATAKWLYPEDAGRSYADIDLLVDPNRFDEAGRCLASLGFRCTHSDRELDPFAEPHGETWGRNRDRAAIDLHWRIPGTGLEAARSWQILRSSTVPLQLPRGVVRSLDEPARALHLALHAVQDGFAYPRALADLEQGIERLDKSTWREAAAMAVELGAVEPMAVALRMAPAGGGLADMLGLGAVASERWEFAATTPPRGALRLQALLATGAGRAATVRALAGALIPPPSYMRAAFPSARRGNGALVLAYVRRALTALPHLPAALRAVWRQRNSTGRGGD